MPRDGGGRFVLRVFECTKPVIAAINGPAVGVGATMTLPMDIRLAADDARIGFVFARRGIVPEACSSWFLPRLVGISRAMEWVATGRVFGAEEALAGGLVRSLHPGGELLDAARALAREIAENTAPVSVALARRLMWTMLGAEHPMLAHRADSRAMFARGQSADAREGIASFLEKRPADFPDRVSEGLPDDVPGLVASRVSLSAAATAAWPNEIPPSLGGSCSGTSTRRPAPRAPAATVCASRRFWKTPPLSTAVSRPRSAAVRANAATVAAAIARWKRAATVATSVPASRSAAAARTAGRGSASSAS